MVHIQTAGTGGQLYYRYSPIIFVVRVINGLVWIIEFALTIRVILELLGSSPSSPFVGWIYNATSAIVAPFAGAFPNMYVSGLYVIDFVAILAMIAYAILGWLVIKIISFVFSSTRIV